MSKGIDYGMGQSNVDTKNGIRFGVIPFRAMSEHIYDHIEAQYPQRCPRCGGDVVEEDLDAHADYEERAAAEYACESCEVLLSNDDIYGEEPSGYKHSTMEYDAESSDGIDIFITRSPYFTRAQFCSPCAPGACYLLNHDDDGERAYCFGHDWFEGDKAPYPVYSVETGELVAK